MLSNCRGFNSKKESLTEVLKDIDPDLCLLNETGLRGRNKVILPGYTTFSRNRVEKSMGGISTSLKDKMRPHVVNIGQGAGEDEYLIIRLDQFNPAICVVNCYGEQEGRVGKEEVNAKWERLLKELSKIKARGEECLFIGDLNKLVGNDQFGVAGNNDKISYGGQLLRELIATEEYCLINNLDIACGGPFTRVDPANANIKSCLDYFICSKNLRPYIKKLLIDSERKFALKRVIHKDGKFKAVLADHFTLVLYMDDLPGKSLRGEKVTRWNLKKEGGWDKYKELAKDVSQKVISIVEDKAFSVEEVVENFYKISDDIKFKAFGKITIKDRSNVKDKPKETSEEEEAKELLRKQREKAEEELNQLKNLKKGRVSNVFQIVRSIQGPKKGVVEAHAVADPESEEIAVTAKDIKRISLDYCKKVLSNNNVKEGYDREIGLKEKLHDERMLDVSGGGFTPSKKLFQKVVLKFKKNNKRNYDFLIRTGERFKEAVFRLQKNAGGRSIPNQL